MRSPECLHFHQRTGDVEKHCERQHDLKKVSKERGQKGFRWGLVRYRATYRDLQPHEVVEYPQAEEKLSEEQASFIQKVKAPTHDEPRRRSPRKAQADGGEVDPKPRRQRSPRKASSEAEAQSPSRSVSPAAQPPARKRHERWSKRQQHRDSATATLGAPSDQPPQQLEAATTPEAGIPLSLSQPLRCVPLKAGESLILPAKSLQRRQ